MDDNALYKFHQQEVLGLEPTKERFNWHCDFECKASDLRRLTMLDVQEEASQWREKTPPKDMYFTHGEYYQDGIQHIIDELKSKPTSNRALYSLMAQNNISKSADQPIPSFLTFQCSIESGSTLYCTATFRALEVGRFFKINLEEIRQNLVEICEKLTAVEIIRLHVFAFHAYVRPTASALRRPKIEMVPDAKLLLLMQDGKASELDQLLDDVQESATAQSPIKLQSLLDILEMSDAKLHSNFASKQRLLVSQLRRTIEACNALAKSRESASRGVNISSLIEVFRAAVKDVRRTLME